MKVVIINSPLFRDRNPLYDEDSLPPIGLGYIATHLQDHGVAVQLIDAVDQRISVADLIATIDYLKPEFLALNIFTTNRHLVQEVVESVTCEPHFIIGGLSTKELYKDIKTWKTKSKIDVVIGDGEFITLDIVNGVLKEAPFQQENKFRAFKVDGGSKYFPSDISNIPLNRSFFLNEPVKHPFGFLEANIVTSRGCIYSCTFCAASRVLNREFPIRERSNESIIKELGEVKTKFPKVNSIRVLDDLFLKTKENVQKAIDVFSNFDFQWRSMAHVNTFNNVDLSTLKALKGSGCNELFIGIESGSPKVLRSIKKAHDLNLIVDNLTRVLKAGIDIKGYFIYGFPDEKQEDMEQTYQLAVTLRNVSIECNARFRTSVFQYRPYHATAIYNELQEKGLDLNAEQIAPNQELSHLVGRIQFNFHSRNVAAVDLETLHSYIYRTTNLNRAEIFAGIGPENQSGQNQQL
jgi:anaerobic magnesium-protoporphyrin IX monomethyl ester cyclase